MVTPIAENSARPDGWLLFAFKIIVATITALGALNTFSLVRRNLLGDVLAVMFVYCIVSMVCRFGWVIPFMAAGVIYGIASDHVVKGGTPLSQFYESIASLASGTFWGLLFGSIAEIVSTASEGSTKCGPAAPSQGA